MSAGTNAVGAFVDAVRKARRIASCLASVAGQCIKNHPLFDYSDNNCRRVELSIVRMRRTFDVLRACDFSE